MTPKKVGQLQKEAMDLFNGETVSFPGGEGLERATLFAACAKALKLAQQLEELQPTATHPPINHLWRLAEALQNRITVDSFPVPVDKKTVDKLFIKAMQGWGAYLRELPKALADDLSLAKFKSEQVRARAQGAADKKAAATKAPVKKAAPAKKVAPSKKPASNKVAAK